MAGLVMMVIVSVFVLLFFAVLLAVLVAMLAMIVSVIFALMGISVVMVCMIAFVPMGGCPDWWSRRPVRSLIVVIASALRLGIGRS